MPAVALGQSRVGPDRTLANADGGQRSTLLRVKQRPLAVVRRVDADLRVRRAAASVSFRPDYGRARLGIRNAQGRSIHESGVTYACCSRRLRVFRRDLHREHSRGAYASLVAHPSPEGGSPGNETPRAMDVSSGRI